MYSKHGGGPDEDRVNRTFEMAISQLRALESAPALLFNQFEGLMTKGYVTGEKDAQGLYIGLKREQDGYKCFDLRLKENQHLFVFPNHTDDCWREPRWVDQGNVRESFCHYIDDGKHNVWCFDPQPWHVEDTTRTPIAARGVPSMSMRNILWPNHDEIPRNILQLWNGCAHPDGYAHNNMFGLTLFSLAKMFEEVAASIDITSNMHGEEDCDALRSGADLVPHHKLCPDGVKQRIFSNNPYRPSANFQPIVQLQHPSLVAGSERRWNYTADRKDKWGWILDAGPDSLKRKKMDKKVASQTLDSLGFRLSFDLTGEVGESRTATVAIEFMKSYTPEWSSVNIWFNDLPAPGEGTPKLPEDTIKLDSRWEKLSSLSRVVVIHAAGSSTKETSPFADWTYFLKTTTDLRTIHIEPVYTELVHNTRFKFKLSGMRAC
jgi:hypothetical protein